MFEGSKSYVRENSEELDRIAFVFNLDCIFDSTSEGIAVMWSPVMHQYIEKIFARTEYSMDVRSVFCMSSDYFPFMLEGIAAARPADWSSSFPPFSHTMVDTADKVAREWICLNAMKYAQMLARILMDPNPLPTSRKSPEQMRELLKKEQLSEILECYGFKA